MGSGFSEHTKPREPPCFSHNTNFFIGNTVNRQATIDILECTFSESVEWSTDIHEHVVDLCIADYRYYTSVLQTIPTSNPCNRNAFLLLACLSNRLFLNCPSEYWNLKNGKKLLYWSRIVFQKPFFFFIENGCEEWRNYGEYCSDYIITSLFKIEKKRSSSRRINWNS